MKNIILLYIIKVKEFTMKTEKTAILLNMSKDMKEKLEVQAEKEYRTVSNLVLKLIHEYLNDSLSSNG